MQIILVLTEEMTKTKKKNKLEKIKYLQCADLTSEKLAHQNRKIAKDIIYIYRHTYVDY